MHIRVEKSTFAPQLAPALSEIELYVVSSDLPGLDPRVSLRSGDVSLFKSDFRPSQREPAPAPTISAPELLAKPEVPPRISVGQPSGKYAGRVCASGLPPRSCSGSRHTPLDLDRREFPFLPAPREAPELGLETIPLSQHEVEYPAMLEMHDASSLESVEEVNQWRAKPPVLLSSALAGEAVRLPRLPEEEQPKDTTEQVILRRGSTRTFDRAASITLAQLSTILDYATRGLPADFLEPPGAQLNDLYLIVHSVQGLKPGAYFFGREQNTLELLKEGEFRAEAHHLGLEQELPADACVDIFFLADLKRILERYGNRGYRAVQLEAGAIGGRIYLAAYAQHLGATGLTFFDDDVINFFSPHAKDKSAIFLLAIGKPLKRKPQ